jgi:hypothetical protein
MTEPLSLRRTGRFAAAVHLTVLLGTLLVSSGCRKTDTTAGKSKRPPPTVVVESAFVRDVPVEVEAPVDLRPL